MRSVVVLSWKEIRQIFLSPIAYTFLSVFVVFVTYLFFSSFFLYGQATTDGLFAYFPIMFAIVIPGLTMRMWAEERKQGTIEFLLTSPIETWHIVVAKFLAGLVLVVLCALTTIYVPVTANQFGPLDWGPTIGGYLGSIFLGATFIAVAMFLSAFTQDQIVSLLLGVIFLMTLVLIGHPIVTDQLSPGGWLVHIFRTISPMTRYESIGRGVIDIRDLFYFFAMTVFFLYLNVRAIDLRRWR
ncbi:MAG TPA: ABC transporter permease [Planctomycetota bacterium]|nr:ABC transporter permease [Planctomycetota bacterium]